MLELLEREKTILDMLSENGSLLVSDLANKFNVSEVTVRSDLRSLEEKGFVVRSRGGVFPALHKDILDRQRINIDAKKRIAKAAADLVSDGDCLMIEAGTTTALLAKYLTGKMNVQIVTNSMLLFSYARLNPLLRITLVGGTFSRETESVVGPLTIQAISNFNARLAFVGTDGFSVERGMTTQFAEGAAVVRTMKSCADKTWLLADSSKYGKTGFVNVLPLNKIDGIISDGALPQNVRTLLAEHSIQFIEV